MSQRAFRKSFTRGSELAHPSESSSLEEVHSQYLPEQQYCFQQCIQVKWHNIPPGPSPPLYSFFIILIHIQRSHNGFRSASLVVLFICISLNDPRVVLWLSGQGYEITPLHFLFKLTCLCSKLDGRISHVAVFKWPDWPCLDRGC